MNPISAFFVQNIIVIFFIYGLAFFVMGVALALASQRASEFSFVQAIRPLAAFGILHGLHEWFEMFQKIAAQTGGYAPTPPHEMVRVALLVTSFLMLIIFSLRLLTGPTQRRPAYLIVAGLAGLWAIITLVAWLLLQTTLAETVTLADVLARYSLGIPGALLGTWALMAQQRTFREHAMSQFGRDLVWCATALFLYGVVGQLFVRLSPLPFSNLLNSDLFLAWFGVPIQLFRGALATILTVFMLRALNAFELESRRRLAEANQAKLMAQAAALEVERRISQDMEKLNERLRLATHELSLLLEISNLLVTGVVSFNDRLQNVLQKIVQSLTFPEAGLILLIRPNNRSLQAPVILGFAQNGQAVEESSAYQPAFELAEQSLAKAVPVCRHLDGRVIEFVLEEQQKCRDYVSPVTLISLPLIARQQVIGSLVLGQAQLDQPPRNLSSDEFRLMIGIAQQLGLSLENARLYQEAQERESMLGELLHQVVGAQEAERQRIARELHDATGQSLTAIALGLRGIETVLDGDPPELVAQIRELQSFSTNALGELRQIIAGLRPSQLDDLGLVAAIQWYVQEFEKRRAIAAHFIVEGRRVRLLAEYEIVLFRIVQEALTNVAKHARARQAEVKLEFSPAQIEVTIRDNGRGFDPKLISYHKRPHAGWGLLGIQERALLLGGQFTLDSQPGQGTSIRVKVPLMMEVKDVKDTAAVG